LFDEVSPLLASGIERVEPDFDSCDARVAGRAKGLQIGEIEREFGMRAHGLYVVHLKPAGRGTFHAFPAVAPLDRDPNKLPPRRANDCSGVPMIF
jgi:hypothetical protein